jgi:hypothetical protein
VKIKHFNKRIYVYQVVKDELDKAFYFGICKLPRDAKSGYLNSLIAAQIAAKLTAK